MGRYLTIVNVVKNNKKCEECNLLRKNVVKNVTGEGNDVVNDPFSDHFNLTPHPRVVKGHLLFKNKNLL